MKAILFDTGQAPNEILFSCGQLLAEPSSATSKEDEQSEGCWERMEWEGEGAW